MIPSFSHVPVMESDPIFGINDLCNQDPDPRKVNLVVGVYFNEDGKIPAFDAVNEAHTKLLNEDSPKNYLPIDGLPEYNRCVAETFLSDKQTIERTVVIQTIAGSGSLRIGSDFLKCCFPKSKIFLSDPTWTIHKAIFEASNLEYGTYEYYNTSTMNLDSAACLSSIDKLPTGSILLLHNSCHNPTGFDLSTKDWEEISNICERRGLLPYIDCAYAGFRGTVEEDLFPFRLFSRKGIPFLASISFSKNMSLYNNRIGALMVVCGDKKETAGVLSQLKKIIRNMYSNPPAHASRLVTKVLTDPTLKDKWQQQLTSINHRLKKLRADLFSAVSDIGGEERFSFLKNQNGLLSYTGLTVKQCHWLRSEKHIYITDNGRMCISGLNSKNIEYVAKGLVEAGLVK